MKNIYIFLAVIALFLVSFKGQAQTITYNEAFTQNQTPTTQCTAWGVFRSQLLGTHCYSGFTIRGSQNMTGITCTDPIVATAVANALRTSVAYSGTSNGHSWGVTPGCGSGCGGGVVTLHVNATFCSCASATNTYIVRPEIANQNWGGIAGPTCNAVSQTLIVEFFYAPAGVPTVTCPSNVTVNNDAGNCDAVVNYTMPTVASCDAYTTTQTAGLASGSAFPVGTTTNTFSATNGFGTVTCSFTVTVVDAENPTVSCPGPVTINTDAGQCTSTASIGTATGTDNCAAPTITSNAPASFPIGNTTVTWTSTDASSNSVTCTQVVTVVDAENPIITCPANVGSCDSVVIGLAPTSSDNCTGATVAYTLTGATTGAGTVDASGSTVGVGITTVQYTVTDGSSNQATCSFTVEVFAPLTGTVANAICAGDSMVINGTTYNAGNPTGTEVFTNVGPNMCDSTVTVNLTITHYQQ